MRTATKPLFLPTVGLYARPEEASILLARLAELSERDTRGANKADIALAVGAALVKLELAKDLTNQCAASASRAAVTS